MSDTQTSRSRPDHVTSGTAERPPQRLNLPMRSFDLPHESEQLRQEATYQAGDRNARTLMKEDGLRVVLTVLRSGAQLKEHKATGPISIQTVAGHISVQAAGERFDLPVGHVVMLDGGVMHDVEATEESAFLLTIASV